MRGRIADGSRLSSYECLQWLGGRGGEMRNDIAYKNCLIRGESFQREKNGKWVAQYLMTRQIAGASAQRFPSQQYQLYDVFGSEDEADDFALRRAMEWIDQTE